MREHKPKWMRPRVRSMRSLLLVGLLAMLTLSGCVEETPEGGATPWEFTPSEGAASEPIAVEPAPIEAAESNATPEATPLRFLLIGDQGTGDGNQHAVADAMVTVCGMNGCDFVMTMGDNIYEYGATSSMDDQFETKFEQPYADLDVPFFLSLGNHDNGGLGFVQALGQYQVDYHYRTDRTSDKWNMPDRFYSHRFGDDLEIFVLDSDSIQRADPTVVNRQDPSVEYSPEGQQAWLREHIDASDANWKIAFGHYNYVSNGNYGDGSADFKAALENSICDRVQFYAQGHDHDLQWIKPVESCGRTEFIGSSAAGKARGVDPEWEFEARFGMGDIYGFAWAEIVGDQFTVEFWDKDLNMLHRETVTKQQLGW